MQRKELILIFLQVKATYGKLLAQVTNAANIAESVIVRIGTNRAGVYKRRERVVRWRSHTTNMRRQLLVFFVFSVLTPNQVGSLKHIIFFF